MSRAPGHSRGVGAGVRDVGRRERHRARPGAARAGRRVPDAHGGENSGGGGTALQRPPPRREEEGEEDAELVQEHGEMEHSVNAAKF